MATDTVSNVVLVNTPVRLVIKLLNKSGGTGESGVHKVVRANYTGSDGAVPSGFLIDRIDYDCAGQSVSLSLDTTSAPVIARLNGYGTIHYACEGAGLDTLAIGGTGGTGDILVTTDSPSTAAVPAATYDITLYMRKN